MLKKLCIACLLLCLVLVSTTRPARAREAQKASNDDLLSQLQAEGWKIVKNGVLQRELVPGRVESFVFGPEGFTWKLQDLRQHLRNVQRELQVRPTPELQQAVVGFRKEIASTRKMIQLAQAAEDQGETSIDKVSCSLSFSYDATASYGTSVQGTWGNASASFTGNCGFTGQVYATAYSKVTVAGAPTTKTVTDGPRSGANVSASAYASLNGGSVCESNSYASMTSSSLNPSSYTISATNSICPTASNPTPSISGTNYVYVSSGCVSTTWTSSVSGGTSPYTYSWTWNGTVVGTGSSYTRSTCAGSVYSYTTNTLALKVTDNASRIGNASLSVDVEKDPGSGGTCLAIAADGKVTTYPCP
jgi:hypothetical protein